MDSEGESEGEDWVRERREEWKKLLEYSSKSRKHGFPEQVWDIDGITDPGKDLQRIQKREARCCLASVLASYMQQTYMARCCRYLF